MFNHLCVGAVGLMLLSMGAVAEKKPITIASGTQFEVSVVVDTEVNPDQQTEVVLDPKAVDSGKLSEPLPSYCLLNTTSIVNDKHLALQAGKMVCVTDDKRILEAQLSGTVDTGLNCDSCTDLKLSAGETFTLQIDSEATLNLQVRADGMAQE
ncbi:hypothetical protein [Gynuella sp.]|uniref:hypothetical protein n=1 Tax=Gynuella sp. TaxID=2969146 RepID=UPI003D0A0665